METIKLDLIPGKKMPSLHASQYDDGREHGIDLFENGVAYKLDGTETLTINERKGDDCICSLDIENTFADSNHIVFASTEQMCAVWGNNLCELVIAKGEKTIGTLNFILEIEPSPTENGIESESEIKNLKRQVEAITEEVIGDDYYTAEQTDEAIENATDGKADTTYVNEELAKKADKTDTYTKTQVDNALNNKMNKANPTGTGSISVGSNMLNIGSNSQTFGSNTKALGNNAFATGENTQASVANQFVFGKYNQYSFGNLVEIVGNGTSESNRSNARTLDWSGNETLAGDLTFNRNKSLTSEISRLDGKIDNLPAPMIFKGTLGVGGTIQSLPTASASNEGYTYKVITGGTYAGQTAKVGDVFTSNGSAWVYIPSGDEDNDTWRAIKVNGTEELGSGISSGSVDFVGSENIDVEFDSDGNKIGIKTKNIYTKAEVNEIVADAIYDVLPSEVASGSVANFETDLALPIKSLEVDVNAVQESGTPTPATPLPISGWNAITLDVNGNTEVINLGGTYYGGHFTQDKYGHRHFEVTHEIMDLSTRNWLKSGYSWRYQCETVNNMKITTATSRDVQCSAYYPSVRSWSTYNGASICINQRVLVLSDDRFQNDVSGLMAWLREMTNAGTPVIAVYPLATPIIIDLPDGEPIITLIGTNNIFADTGDTSVVFKNSVNGYVEKKIASVQALALNT